MPKTCKRVGEILFKNFFMKRQSIILLLSSLIFFNETYSQDTAKFTGTIIKPVVDENIPVYRIELRLVTAGGEWDGTDNELYVQLDRNDAVYFLDYGRDDFSRNADQRFDILSQHIRTIKDIDFIKFGVKNNDQWGIKKVELYLNNSSQPVFSKTYGAAVVINNHAGQSDHFLISSAELRSNASWLRIPHNTGLKALPIPVKFTMIKSIVESMVGNQLHHSGEKNLQWGSTDDVNTVWGPWVEANYVNSKTLHFDLDLEYAIPNSPDAEIDVDFDLVFSCDNGNVTIKTANVNSRCKFLNINCDRILNIVNNIITLFGVDPVKIDAGGYQNNFTRMFTISAGDNKCHSITVTPAGDVIIF